MNIKDRVFNLDLSIIDCDYCDVRVEDVFEATIRINNGDLTTCLDQKTVGAFLRLKKNGMWLYSSITDLSQIENGLKDLAQKAKVFKSTETEIPRKNNGVHELVKHKENNYSKISLADKRDLVQSYVKIVNAVPQIKSSVIMYKDMYKIKAFKNSVGTAFEYDFNSGSFIVLFDLTEGENNFSDYQRFHGVQFENLKNKEAEMAAYIQESIPFLTAPTIEPGKYQVVMNPQITGVFTHESFGHNSEADFMLGDPLAVQQWRLGQAVAVPQVSLIDSGLHADSSGHCPIDDEGEISQKTYLIKEGILNGRLHNIETSNEMNEPTTGNGRAMNFEFEPIVRMTATYIENGTTPLDELYKKAEGGLYFQGYNYGSGMSTFTIAPVRAFRIKNGKASEPVRATVISGSVFETLMNIQAVGNDFDLNSSAIGGCGKMTQMPLPVAMGGPTILVKDMQVS